MVGEDLAVEDAPGYTRGQARGVVAGMVPDTEEALLCAPFRLGPLKPLLLLTYRQSNEFAEHRVQGFSPSHLRCLDRHWTHAEGTVTLSRSLVLSGVTEATDACGCPRISG